MDTGDILGSLGGVVIGWGLTQASTWLGTRQADRRLGKEVLFSLLELHRLLVALDRSYRLRPAMIAIIREYTTPPRPDMEAAVDKFLHDFLGGMAKPWIGRQLAGLKTSYDAALLKLASLDPVGAHRLRGLDELLQNLPQLVEAMQTSSLTHLGEPLTLPTGATAFLQEHFEVADVAQAVELLRDIMQDLARQLGRRTRRGVAAEVGREQAREQELPGKFAEYMKKVAAAFPASPPL